MLVNEMLKFQTLISQICQYILLKKCETAKASPIFFSTKNIWVFSCKVIKLLTSRPLNEHYVRRLFCSTRNPEVVLSCMGWEIPCKTPQPRGEQPTLAST